jgi:hypothetical protein
MEFLIMEGVLGELGSATGREDSADHRRQFGKWITTRRKEVHSKRRPSKQTDAAVGL